MCDHILSKSFYGLLIFTTRCCYNTDITFPFLYWRHFRQWLHRKLPFWQLPVLLVTKISSKLIFIFNMISDIQSKKIYRFSRFPNILFQQVVFKIWKLKELRAKRGRLQFNQSAFIKKKSVRMQGDVDAGHGCYLFIIITYIIITQDINLIFIFICLISIEWKTKTSMFKRKTVDIALVLLFSQRNKHILPDDLVTQGVGASGAIYGHYCDVIMGTMTSLITSLTSVYLTVHSGADQRKHQISASLAFVRGIHRRPVNSPHKWPVTRRMFPFDDVIMVMT